MHRAKCRIRHRLWSTVNLLKVIQRIDVHANVRFVIIRFPILDRERERFVPRNYFCTYHYQFALINLAINVDIGLFSNKNIIKY